MSWKILHFEDHDPLRQLYAIRFKREHIGYKSYIHPPETAKELIGLVLREKPNLIIMSIIMPIMNGFEATEILKGNSRTRNIPIIGLSSVTQARDIKKAKDIGMDTYFVKSKITPDNFIKIIKKTLYGKNNKIH